MSAVSNSNKTLKSMQDLNGWNVDELQPQMLGRSDEDEMNFENYTVTPSTGHTPLMQTAVLQEH